MRLSEAIDLFDGPLLRDIIDSTRGSDSTPQESNSTPQESNFTPQESDSTPQGSNSTPGATISTPRGTSSTTPKGSPISNGAPSPLRWADLGCGSGLFTEALARFLPAGSTIYGLDLRPMLQSESVGGVRLVPVSTDFINIPLPVTGLNGILMANSFHYVADKPAFLSMLTRPQHPDHPESAPLLPGSPLLFVEYDTDTPVSTWVPWPVSLAKLRPLLAAAGWSKVLKLGERPSAFGRSNIYAAVAKIK